MHLIINNSRATYISLIKKCPKGVPSRLEHYDRWVAGWKEQNVHTYYDYFHNGETRK